MQDHVRQLILVEFHSQALSIILSFGRLRIRFDIGDTADDTATDRDDHQRETDAGV